MKLLFLIFPTKALENNLNLKNKYFNVVDVETGESIKMHPKQIKEKYINERKVRLSEIHNLLKTQKVDLVSADIELGFDQILMEYIIKKKKNKLNCIFSCYSIQKN